MKHPTNPSAFIRYWKHLSRKEQNLFSENSGYTRNYLNSRFRRVSSIPNKIRKGIVLNKWKDLKDRDLLMRIDSRTEKTLDGNTLHKTIHFRSYPKENDEISAEKVNRIFDIKYADFKRDFNSKYAHRFAEKKHYLRSFFFRLAFAEYDREKNSYGEFYSFDYITSTGINDFEDSCEQFDDDLERLSERAEKYQKFIQFVKLTFNVQYKGGKKKYGIKLIRKAKARQAEVILEKKYSKKAKTNLIKYYNKKILALMLDERDS